MSEKYVPQDEDAFEQAVDAALNGFGAKVRALVASRRAQGLEDPVLDLSPERQQYVIDQLEAEIARLRPMKDRLLNGVKE